MKRSEALILIANQLDFLNSKFEGFITEFTKEQLSNADVILTTLEQAGMIPPTVFTYDKEKADLELGVSFSSDRGHFIVCEGEWEPEDT